MAKFLAIFPALIFACPTLLHAEEKPKPDVALQRVFTQYGVASKILRPFDQLKEITVRKDGQFFFDFEGSPGLQVLLDRNHWVLVTWNAKKEKDVLGYVFNPKDEQSALNITIGNDFGEIPDAELRESPGFTEITSREGVVDGQKVVWRRWADKEHLYSDCTLRMSARDKGNQPDHKVNIHITANTQNRRSALEASMATLRLQYSKQ